MSLSRLPLFGQPNPWIATDWTAQDDRVRGGSSVSELIPSADGTTALITGTLDTTTLGGAGFASQRTTEERVWDLRGYDGLEITACREDGDEARKVFTLVMKDVEAATYTDAASGRSREESTVSYEATFRVGAGEGEEKVFLPWVVFKGMYRGREKEVPPVDLGAVRRFSVMVRSFFDTQSGPFRLTLSGITAVKRPAVPLRVARGGGAYDEYDEFDNEHDDHDMGGDHAPHRSWCSVL